MGEPRKAVHHFIHGLECDVSIVRKTKASVSGHIHL